MIEYRKATLRDVPALQTLVAPEVVSGVILERNSDEMSTNIRSYWIALEGGVPVGMTALHVHSVSLAEIRSLIVTERLRGSTIGTQLVQKAEEEARTLGIERLLALTYQQPFFERLGFEEIDKESLPEHKIWADCIKCKHFPVCNEIALIKHL